MLGAAGQLADLIDKADTGLLLDLGTILGMNKFKELQQRLQAVPVARPDTRPRMWISPANPEERLVFDCQRGAIDLLKEPLGEPPWDCVKSGVWSLTMIDFCPRKKVHDIMCGRLTEVPLQRRPVCNVAHCSIVSVARMALRSTHKLFLPLRRGGHSAHRAGALGRSGPAAEGHAAAAAGLRELVGGRPPRLAHR